MSAALVGQVLSLVSGGLTDIFKLKRDKMQQELQKRGLDLDEKKLDAMLEVTEIELQKYVLANSLKIDTDFRDFVTRYEGAAEDVHPAVQFLRAIIRPVITLWSVGIISWLMFADPAFISDVADNIKKIPEELWDIFYIVFLFWFGGRAAQHLMEKYAQGRVAERKVEARGNVEVAIESTNRERVIVGGAAAHELPNTHFTQEELEDAMPKARRQRSGRKFR